jgi:SAM-dependent methyltransferase
LGYGEQAYDVRRYDPPESYPDCSRKLVELFGRDAWYVDVGTGFGGVPLQIAQAGGRSVAVDISPQILGAVWSAVEHQGLSERVICACMNAYQMNLASGCAAAVIVNRTFLMLDSPTLLLQETARLLRPGGAMVTYCECPEENQAETLYDRAHGEILNVFEQQLRQAGYHRVWFETMEDKLAAPFFEPPQQIAVGPAKLRVKRLSDLLRQLRHNGLNRYQHIPAQAYQQAWEYTQAYALQTYGADYAAIYKECRETSAMKLYVKRCP